MLTLVRSMTIEGYPVFRDDTVPSRFYVLPTEPRIAREDGKPVASLIVYRQDEARITDAEVDAGKDVGGGIFTCTVELSIDDRTMKTIKGKITREVFGQDAENDDIVIELDYVPFTEGSVQIAIAGERGAGDAGDEFVDTIIGAGKVSGIGPNRKAIMAKLSQSGAALLSQLQDTPVLPMNIEYVLTFEHRLVGVTMRVWCQMESAYKLVKELERYHVHEEKYLSSNDYTASRVTAVREEMTRNKVCGVEVKPLTSEIDQDTLLSMEKFGFDMLDREMAKAVEARTASDGQVGDVWLREYASSATNSLNFKMTRDMVLKRDHVASANAGNVLAESPDLIVWVDLRTGFFTFMDVPIRVNADFKKMGIGAVTVSVELTRPQVHGAGTETVVQSFEFQDATAIKRFRAFANSLDALEYRWWAEVHYVDSPETYQTDKTHTKETILVVDAGRLGVLHVDAGLGLVDLDKYPKCKASFRYTPRRGEVKESQIVFDKETQVGSWVAVVREPAAEFEYKVDWLRDDDTQMPGQWETSGAERLRFDAPSPDTMGVSVVPSGDFKKDVAHVLATLRYEDEDNAYVQEKGFHFTDDKEVAQWDVPLRNPSLRKYQYRSEVVYKTGRHEKIPEDGWLDGPPGFVVVGVLYDIEVDVHPFLLTWPPQAQVVVVEFVCKADDGTVLCADSFTFNSANNTSQTWRGRTGLGARPWQATVRYYAADGAVRTPPVEVRPAGTDTFVIPSPAPLHPPAPGPAVTPAPAEPDNG